MYPFFWPRRVVCAQVVLAIGGLAAGGAGTVGARGLPPAADPDVPVPVVPWRSALADGPKGLEATHGDWRQVNTAVAGFPRGHADILKWELQTLPALAGVQPTATGTSKSVAPYVHSTPGKP